jgi:nucleoside-diphosphate-sugar epimerase
MKILITGGGGFLGLHLASYFNKKGSILTLVDIQEFKETEYPDSATLVVCDIRNKKKIRGAYTLNCNLSKSNFR